MGNQGQRYDKIAVDYAALRNSFSTEKKYLDQFIELLQPKAHVLDIGCGSGYPIAAYLLEHHFQVTGIDGSQELLTIAKKNHPLMKQIYGDIRSVEITEKYDGIIEWWCLFHLPKQDQIQMIARFAEWMKPNGILEFTTGDSEIEFLSSDMLEQELLFFSCAPSVYERALIENGFELLMKESDQDQHLVWLARKAE